MATLSAKPGLRYSVSDWDPSNKLMSDTAEQRRHISHETRQEGRTLRNETTSKESRQQLTHDIQNKAQDIDLSCLSLTVTSSDSLKPNPLRIPISSTTSQQWEQFSQYNMAQAQETMQASQQLREDMSH
ncbi:LOW QUALITY PROTEIN: tektin-2 [Salvelinus alpinus]